MAGAVPLDTISLTRLLGQLPRSGASSLTQRFESRARRRRLDQIRSKAKLHSESCSGIGPEAPAPLSLPSLLSSRLTGASLIYRYACATEALAERVLPGTALRALSSLIHVQLLCLPT